MISVVNSAVLDGFGAKEVRVEVDITRGLPGFFMVGLAENCVKESRVRVQAAITNAGFDFPRGKISVNLAPADVQKRGTAFDLTIALAILQASGVIPALKMTKVAAIGELSLTGEIRPVRGMLSLAESIKQQGMQYLIVADENGKEAGLIDGLKVKTASNFQDVVNALLSDKIEDLKSPAKSELIFEDNTSLDMADVCGQEEAKRALLIAAAGNHNFLLVGSPGSGKSMMAHRLTSILPPLNYEESLSLTKIYSLAGLTLDGNLIAKRPFRSPHHSVTKAGLIGGGSVVIRPGEISLASFGVLFLDELLEFPRSVLEVLRQPLESGTITLSRASHSATYPATIALACALNPCPCGNFGHPQRDCICSELTIRKYQSKLSGPLIDRIDLYVHVWPVKLSSMQNGTSGHSSLSLKNQVISARKLQEERLGLGMTNGKMNRQQITTKTFITSEAMKFLIDSAEKLAFSARGFDRIIKVARTIADLELRKEVNVHHIGEALYYRPSSGFMRK